jgi:multidrug efflux system outer membrane protein
MRDSLHRPWVIACLGAVLAACTVGPQYSRPDSAAPAGFDQATADPSVPAELGVQYAEAAVDSALWHSFGDPVLLALIERASAANRDLAATAARLNEARAIRGLETFALFPTVTAGADGERSKPSAGDPFIPPDIGITETWRAGFDVLWEIDLFGGTRQTRRAISAEVEAAAADLEAARIALTAEVAQAYFSLRAEQDRLRVQQAQVDNLRENLRLLELRRDAGRGTELDVARSNALGLAVAARLPLTRAAVAGHEQRLAVLTAWPITRLRETLGAAAALPVMPQLVAIGSPEDWLRRRPDVRAAERRLAAATAEIGVEVAEYFPKLSLTGSFGWTAQEIDDLGRDFTERFRVGPSISWSFLDFGRVRQRVLAAEARAEGALAEYEQSVLLALEEVESALAQYRGTHLHALTLERAVARAGDAHALARLRFDAGASSTLEVLDAERTQLDLEDQYASAQAARATALASLYKALAGDFARSAGESEGVEG